MFGFCLEDVPVRENRAASPGVGLCGGLGLGIHSFPAELLELTDGYPATMRRTELEKNTVRSWVGTGSLVRTPCGADNSVGQLRQSWTKMH